MTGITKRRTLILLGLVMIMTIIIAASLPRLEFQPGMPLPKLDNGQVVAAPAAKAPSLAISADKFFGVFFALFLAGSMLYALYKLLIQGFHWKNITAILQRLLVISLIVAGVVRGRIIGSRCVIGNRGRTSAGASGTGRTRQERHEKQESRN